jgi:transposase-like protein
MKTDFKSKIELVRYYADEDNCKKLLAEQRWGDSPACPHCGNAGKIYITSRGYKCGDKDCHKKFTVITGTIFENTKIKLNLWFEAIFVITAHKKGISSHQLAKDINVSQKTAWFILHRVREMLKDKNPSMLSGTVQADTTYVGGKITNKHQSIQARLKKAKKNYKNDNKTMVLGLVQQDGKVVSKVIPSEKNTDIIPVLTSHIEAGSTMVTDDAPVYTRLPKLGYPHESVNHSLREYVREGWHTNTIEGYFSQLKRGIIGIYHQVSPQHLHRYCDEFSFRYNSRKVTDVERFTTSLKQSDGARLRWNDLVASTDPVKNRLKPTAEHKAVLDYVAKRKAKDQKNKGSN